MGGKRNRKIILLLTTIILLVTSIVSVGFAAGNYTTLKAAFRDIKIFNNGIQVYLEDKPFIVEGRTYVPVRAVSEILNKDVKWTQESYRIDINDKEDDYTNNLILQILEKQNKIIELEAKVKKLEADLKNQRTSTSSNLADLEKYLNNEYGLYKDVRFNIELLGNTRDIKVNISINRNDNYEWELLYNTDIEKYIGYIVDDILWDFDNAKITGIIINNYTRKEVLDFYLSPSNKLIMDTNYYSNDYIYSLRDMEYYLNRYYGSYTGYEGRVNFDIKLYGNEDNIEIDIVVDELDWYYFGKSYQEQYLEEIYDEIKQNFKYADIDGYLYDGYDNYYFYYTSKGVVRLNR